MDLTSREFTSSEVANLSGWGKREIQNMTSRKVFASHVGGGGQGKHFKYSWYNVMEAACGKSLYEIGLSKPAVAINAAMSFSHAGHDPTNLEGNSQSSQISRYPGFPYHQNLGETVLYVSGEYSAVHLVSGDKMALSEISSSLHRPDGYISLNVTAVFRKVCSRLGRHPHAVLDELYPEVAS